jgi:hypothetical protein
MSTMRWMTTAVVVIGLAGCRAQVERGEPPSTVFVSDARTSSSDREYDNGDRRAQRIEVVVSDPRGGTAVGPSPLTALIGKTVKVQFRRDLLGQSAAAPIPPTGQGPGGRAVHVIGTVRSVSGGWLVLEREKNTYWIPQASILLIEQSDEPTTGPSVE